MKKHPVLLAVGVVVVYVTILLFYDLPFNVTKFRPTRLPEVVLGMYFVKYIKKVNIPMLVTSIAILLANGIIKPTFSVSLQTTYVGIA